MNQDDLLYAFYFGTVRVRPLVRCESSGSSIKDDSLCAIIMLESKAIDIGIPSANPQNPIARIEPSN